MTDKIEEQKAIVCEKINHHIFQLIAEIKNIESRIIKEKIDEDDKMMLIIHFVENIISNLSVNFCNQYFNDIEKSLHLLFEFSKEKAFNHVKEMNTNRRKYQ